jgi:hypothetical protein
MKKVKRFFIILLFSLMVLTVLAIIVVQNIMPSTSNHAIIIPESWISEKTRSYVDQIAFIFELSGKFVVNEIGVLNYPGREYILYKISYGNLEADNPRRYLFISGIHGNEIAPVYAMKEFIQYLDSIELLENIIIDFIYIANPFGFEYNLRFNGQGYDLNRDFLNFNTFEVQILIDSIEGKLYTKVFDFHEHGRTTGFFLYYYSRRNSSFVKNISEMLWRNNIPLENEFVDVILSARNRAIRIPFLAKIYWLNILGEATSGLYFDKIGVDAFVTETPTIMEIEERKAINLLLMKNIVGL